MVLAVPGVPASAGRGARRPPPPARGRPFVCPFPARRADGRGRRLPRGPARGRGSPPSPRVQRTARDGPLVRPHGRVPRVRARRSCATSSSASSAPPQFGGAMPVGYLPDMFGHIAQMPQLLQQFGFDDAVVWRGVPVAVDRTAFWWSSPDGSTVRAEYLPNGYGNGAVLPDDGKALLERISSWIESNQRDRPRRAAVLIMNGSDHLRRKTFLGQRRRRGERGAGRPRARGHVARGLSRDGTARRSSPLAGRAAFRCARANLLMGVASNRVDVRRAAAATERSLERLAEPLSALFLPAEAWPGELLDHAWLEVIRNAAHDSICACSVDEVCEAVAAPLRRGPPDRRRTHRPRRPRARQEPATARTSCAEPLCPARAAGSSRSRSTPMRSESTDR